MSARGDATAIVATGAKVAEGSAIEEGERERERERGDVEGDDAGAGDEESLTRLRACLPSRRERNSADCDTS